MKFEEIYLFIFSVIISAFISLVISVGVTDTIMKEELNKIKIEVDKNYATFKECIEVQDNWYCKKEND